jgi:hypothetical protein
MGATLYYLLVGHDPEPITCSHAKLLRPDMTSELDELIAGSTALDTKKRIATAAEFAQALEKPPQCSS